MVEVVEVVEVVTRPSVYLTLSYDTPPVYQTSDVIINANMSLSNLISSHLYSLVSRVEGPDHDH